MLVDRGVRGYEGFRESMVERGVLYAASSGQLDRQPLTSEVVSVGCSFEPASSFGSGTLASSSCLIAE